MFIADDDATFEDCLRLGRSFHELSVCSHIPLDIEAVAEYFVGFIDNENGYLRFSKSALICGIVMPLWFAPKTLIGVELLWHSQIAGGGKEMRQFFEEWAEERGASMTQFSCMANEHEPALRRIFERAGFEIVELGFRKAL